MSADGESRTPTGLLPHGSEPRLSTCSKHVRKLSRVGRPGIEPGSPGLQPGVWTVLSYRSMERPGRDSNPRLRGCSPADAPLSYLAKAIPGEGFEPDSSLGSEPSVLPVRRSRSVVKTDAFMLSHTAPVPSQSSAPGLAGCLSRSVSDCRPGSFEPGPRTPCGTVRVLPSSARVHPDSPSRTRTSDVSHLGGLAEQRRRPSGRPHRSTGCHATVVRSRTVRSATRCSATTTAQAHAAASVYTHHPCYRPIRCRYVVAVFS